MHAAVIGEGSDALVAAQYIARAGHDVTVVRGGDSPYEPRIESGWIPPQVVRDLELERHGFAALNEHVWARAALDGAGTLDLSEDIAASAEAIRRVSPADAARWPEFCARMHALAELLAALYVALPPDPLSTELPGLLRAVRAGLRLRKLGRTGVEDLLRLMPMSIADLLDDWFENDALKGALAVTGVLNLCQGPRSGGTAFNFLHHHVGSPAGVFVPPISNARDVLRTLPGVRVREGAVTRIVVRQGRVAGVVLANDELLAADCVVSGFGPWRTLVELTDPGLLDPQLVRALGHVRSRGVAACSAFELAGVPEPSRFLLAPSLDHLERAYDDVKYGRASRNPLVEARVSAETSGRGRVEVHVQYVPHDCDRRVNDALWASLVAHVRASLAPYVSGITDAPLVMALTPRDLEHECGFPQGQPYHAEIALDQMLWMRPVPELAQYRTPLEGLYLCGPAMHPGGPVIGAAGANAASVLLRDVKRRKPK
jgi:phytoene dehydrogenase-like protein